MIFFLKKKEFEKKDATTQSKVVVPLKYCVFSCIYIYILLDIALYFGRLIIIC